MTIKFTKMKIRTLIFGGLSAAIALASCSGNEKTIVKGRITEPGIGAVNIFIPAMALDTMVTMQPDSTFYVELPVNTLSMATIYAGRYQLQFIPDGTEMDVLIGKGSKVTSNSNKAHSAFLAMSEKSREIQADFMKQVDEISAKFADNKELVSTKVDSLYNLVEKDFVEYNMEMLSNHKDDILSILGLQNINGMIEDSQMDSVINTFSARVRETRAIVNLQKAIKSRMQSAEGAKFTDFTVEEEKGKTTSFSEFVGNGKLVLVDFWASWCGPCKREMPFIKAVYDKYKGDKFDVLSVAIWDKPEETKQAAKELGITWNQIINAQAIPSEIYGIEGIPFLMLIGPDGTILKKGLRGADIEKYVAEYLEKEF